MLGLASQKPCRELLSNHADAGICLLNSMVSHSSVHALPLSGHLLLHKMPLEGTHAASPIRCF